MSNELKAGEPALIINSPLADNIGKVVTLISARYCVDGEIIKHNGMAGTVDEDGIYWLIEGDLKIIVDFKGLHEIQPIKSTYTSAKNLMPLKGDFSQEKTSAKKTLTC